MPNTFTIIERIEVGAGGASSVTFNSIPQTYTDLLMKVSARTNRTVAFGISDSIELRFNNTTTTYSGRFCFTDGSSASSQAYTSTLGVTASGNQASNANMFSSSEIYISGYSGSTFKPTSGEYAAENNATFGYLFIDAGLWSTTSAITSIVCVPLNAPFLQYSTLALYGISRN